MTKKPMKIDQPLLTEDETYMPEYSVKINKNMLDEECVRMPQDFDTWGRKEVDNKEIRDNLKNKLELIMAKVELEIKSMTVEQINAKYGFDLPENKALTESTAKAIIKTDMRVQMAEKMYFKYKRLASVFGQATRSHEKKHTNLELLVKLHGQGYFAKVRNEVAQSEGQTFENMRDKLKKQMVRKRRKK